jgi:hypothetical protein
VREQTQLDENPMRAGAATELSGAVTALITAWLEVRVLRGPPRILVLTEISRNPAISPESARFGE